jgi:hypothetical protein
MLPVTVLSVPGLNLRIRFVLIFPFYKQVASLFSFLIVSDIAGQEQSSHNGLLFLLQGQEILFYICFRSGQACNQRVMFIIIFTTMGEITVSDPY